MIRSYTALGNRYGFWPQTGCVTVPGCEAAFLVARQRFPYRSRFNFSVKNMENMLLCNVICDIMHIDFNRKICCGANDATEFIKSNESSQNVNVRDVLRHFAPLNRSYWQCINWNAHELFSKVRNDKNNHLWLYMMIIVWNISTFLQNIERIFTNGSLRLQWLNGIGSWSVCDAGWDLFVPWLAAKPQEPMTIAWVNRSQQFIQHVYKIP